MNITEEARQLCYDIENLPASEQQTALSVRAAAFSDMLEARTDLIRKVIIQMERLVLESEGVAGLHQNGDLAPWSELFEGGQFEDWLESLPKAVAMINEGLL